MIIALAIMTTTLVVSLLLGIRSRRSSGGEVTMEKWAVGGRSLGGVFVFLLMAGEIYTTTTFLGISGFVYGNGGAAFYTLAYVSIAYVASYWLLPAVWKYANERKLLSQADFFIHKYSSKSLGFVVTVIGLAGMVPFLILQLKGLGIIVSEASYGAIAPSTAIVVSAVVLTGYVSLSGLFAAAWTAIIKDVLIVIIVGFLGVYLPLKHFDSIPDMFKAVQAKAPDFMALHTDKMDSVWFISTVAVSALGFYMWPHLFAATFAAKDPQVFRKNAVVFPIYQLFLLFVVFVGFTAYVVLPDLSKSDADLSLMRLAEESLSPLAIGFVGSAGLLAALVPGAMLLNTSGTLIANNIYKPIRGAKATDRQITLVARIAVPIVAIIALGLSLSDGQAIVSLLILAYSFVTQLAPGLFLSLLRKNPASKEGVCAGMIGGTALIGYMTVSGTSSSQIVPLLPPSLHSISSGVVALGFNVALIVLGTILSRIFHGRTDAAPHANPTDSPADSIVKAGSQ
ncbi:sodium:solute symporter family protein [Prescottella equi]